MIVLPVELDVRLTALWHKVREFVYRNASRNLSNQEIDQMSMRTLEQLVNQLERVEKDKSK